MESSEKLKEMVRQTYSEIALKNKAENQSSCCGSGGCSTDVYCIMNDDYSSMAGYNFDLDLGLGFGLPTEIAKIRKGNTVIDLCSGAGNDCLDRKITSMN